MKEQSTFANMFERMFNVLPFGVYVVDVETFEVVYANDVLGIDSDVFRENKCWNVIYGNERECLFCKNRDLLTVDGRPNGKVVVFENFDERRDIWYQLQEQAITWSNGRVVKYSIAVDITSVKIMQNRLAEAHAELSLAHRELEKVAATDRLTGLTNRVKLDELFSQERARSLRHGSPLTVILADIDRFKSVNDTHGHQVGDAVLRGVASLLQREARENDVVGRWGGEEFMILCPETDLDGGALVADRMRRVVAEHPFDVVGPVTCSFGVATMRDDESEAPLLKRADDALYRAKAEGRNRVNLEIVEQHDAVR